MHLSKLKDILKILSILKIKKFKINKEWKLLKYNWAAANELATAIRGVVVRKLVGANKYGNVIQKEYLLIPALRLQAGR
jgi:hypothetical protein